ncbi:MAG TPA: hypothetical protein VG407_01875 [Caulobacteraceae bacterium]|jgi:hypothetical protein|nr:hypothetical protein [Caulobacteraceae bacterium]
MGKTVFAVIVGALVGLLLAAVVGWFGGYMFPPQLPVDMDPAKARTYPMPIGEILFGLIAWILGGLGGGYVAVRQGEAGEWPAWASAAIMAIAAVVFAIFWPHPIWFVILSVLIVVAAGFGAGRLAMRFDPQAERA